LENSGNTNESIRSKPNVICPREQRIKLGEASVLGRLTRAATTLVAAMLASKWDIFAATARIVVEQGGESKIGKK
jgi:hypothetical protein